MYEQQNQNFFKISTIINNIIAEILRDIFRKEWNRRYHPWNDDAASLTAFDNIVQPLPRNNRTVVDLHNRLMKTSGKVIEWDVSLLFYCFMSSALDLRNNNPTLYYCIDPLRIIRNKLQHKNDCSLSDTDFSQYYDDIRKAVKGLGSDYKKYLNEIYLIKLSDLPPSKEEEERNKRQLEKKRITFIKNICVLVFAVFLILVLIWIHIRVNQIEQNKVFTLETTFPDGKKPAYFTGRTTEINRSVSSILSGNHVELLMGPPGIGKTTTAIVISQILRDDHGYNITFVNVKNQFDIDVVAQEILKSFHFTPLHYTRQLFKDFLRERLKHKIIIVIDNMEDILQSRDLQKQTLELLIDMLNSNPNIHILCTSRKSFSLLGFNINMNPLRPLSLKDAVNIIQTINTTVTDQHANELASLCHGIPIMIVLFAKQLSSSVSPSQVISKIRDAGILSEARNGTVADADNPYLLIDTLFGMLDNDLQQAFLSFSVFPVSFTRDASESLVHGANEIITKLVKFSVVEKFESSSRFTIHPLLQEFAYMKCNETKQWKMYCQSSEISFHGYYMSFISVKTKQFFVKRSKQSFISFQEEITNIQKALDSALEHPSLFDQYYDMIVSASDMLLFGVEDKIFSRYFDKAATFAKDHRDHERYMALLFLQGDRGDVYFYHHKDKYDKIQKLADTEVALIEDEDTCKGNTNSRELGMCLCAKARAYALYASRKDWSPKVNSIYNISMAFDLIQRAKEVFKKLDLKHELAMAISLMGLLKKNWSNYTEAVDVYTEALNIYRDLYSDHACTAATYYNIGYMYMKMGGKHYTDAADAFLSSYNIFKKALGNHRRTAAAIYHAGESMRIYGNLEQAMEYLLIAYEIQSNVNRTTRDTAETLGEIGNLMYASKRYKEACDYAKKSLNIMLVPGVMSELKHRETAFTYHFIGNCQRRIGQKSEAALSYKKAIDIFIYVCGKKNRACDMIDRVKNDLHSLLNAPDTDEENVIKGFLENLYDSVVTFLVDLYHYWFEIFKI